EVKHQQTLFRGAAALDGALHHVVERLKVGLQCFSKPSAVERRASFLGRLPHGEKLQTVCSDDGLEIGLVELPSQDLLARSLKVEKEERRRNNKNYSRKEHIKPPPALDTQTPRINLKRRRARCT